MRTEWEYDEIRTVGGFLPVQELDKMGEQGWEMVSVVFCLDQLIAYFKRPVIRGSWE